METHTASQRPRRSRRYLGLILIGSAFSLMLSSPTHPPQASGVATMDQPKTITTTDQLSTGIAEVVGPKDDLALAVKDLDTGEEFRSLDTKSFDGASTTKIVIAAHLYDLGSSNDVDLDKVLTLKSSEIQHYGTGSIQYEKAPYKYSWRELTKRMMLQSDNTSAYVLTNRLGRAKLQAYAKAHGLASTDLANANTTTAADMLSFMIALYQGELLDPSLNQELLGFMRNTQFEDRLPAKLPAGAVVTHKTGDAFDSGLHDVGVVEFKGHRYAIALFSHGLTADEVATVSRDVFDYFTRQR